MIGGASCSGVKVVMGRSVYLTPRLCEARRRRVDEAGMESAFLDKCSGIKTAQVWEANGR